MEDKEGGKRVTFKLRDKEEKEVRDEGEMRVVIRQIVRKEIKDSLKEQEDRLRKKIEDIKVSLKREEEKIEGLSKIERKWEEKWKETKEEMARIGKEIYEKVENRVLSGWQLGEEEGEFSETRSREGLGYESERETIGSRGSRRRSMSSGWSDDRLSSREVDKVRKMVTEKEREERKCNIIIRGLDIPEEIERERGRRKIWVKELIRNKVGVECEVKDLRKSGPVFVAKIEGENKKREIMMNKYKLKGERMFIENDLTYEERKVQEKLGKWAREKRAGGMVVKIGRGRVKVGSRWINWEEIEREGREKEEDGGKEKTGEEESAARMIAEIATPLISNLTFCYLSSRNTRAANFFFFSPCRTETYRLIF